ncbi:MAG: S41 family peptidase [Saprospiraceae bacterium]
MMKFHFYALNKLKYLFLFLLLCSTYIAFSQTDKKYTPTELHADLQAFRDNMEKIHPALYLYFPKDSLDHTFEKIEKELTEPLTDIEFYRRLTPLLKYIANGHTDIIPSKSHLDKLANTLPRFPFDTFLSGDTLFVYRNVSEDLDIEPGIIINKINGEKPMFLVNYFATQISRDGFNTSGPTYYASRAFKSYYALLLGTPEFYDIEFQHKNGKIFEKKIKAVPMPKIREFRNERYPNIPKSFWETNEPALTLSIDQDVATMTLRTFDKKTIRKRGERHKKFFKKSFAEINDKNIQHLVIDLRGNGGGDPEPTAVLFSHLFNRPFDFYKDMGLLVNRIPNANLYEGGAKLLNLFAWARVKKRPGGYVAKSMKRYNKNKPAKNIFKNEVYVLTDPHLFFTTGEMTGIIKNFGLATFIGEEPGGNPVTNTSGIMLPLILPNTKTKVVLPIVQFVMAVDMENTGHGVIPDFEVKNTIWDQINGKDSVMEFTRELIKTKK